MRILRFIGAFMVALAIGSGFVSCSEEIDTSNRYTFVGETMGDFLLNREDRFSSMIKIFDQAKMMGLLSTYGQHTLFLPEDTAVTLYLRQQYELYDSTLNDPNAETVWTGITSPYLEDLSDSMAVVIANTHLVPYTYEMVDMQEGVLDTRNYNARYLSISYAVVNEMSRTLINNQSGIIEGDNLVENGVVHVVDAVVSPSTNTIAKHISDQPFFSLFAAALQKTAFENNLKDYALQLNGKDYDLGQKYATCFQCGDAKQMSARYPHTYFAKYTAFVETDDVFAENGINNVDDLIEKCYEWYGREDELEFTSPNNALYKFVAYHFLDRELNYNLMVQYKLEHDSYKSEGSTGLRPDIDRVDYFETLLGKLVKVCKPLSSSKVEESQNLFLNFSHRSTKQDFMRKHLDVCIYDMTTFNNMDEKYADFTQGALNGVVHPINRILVYNEAEMQGNVLNERMRFDIASILPELTTNGVRFGRWQKTGGTCSHGDYNIPDGYCKNLVFRDKSTVWHYFCPYSWGCNYLGDEIIVVGNYDFEYILPPVPAGTYELRLGYTATNIRAVTQFYVDGKVTGIPVDLKIYAYDERIGWIEDKETEDEGVENDKVMRSHGYMKAPDSYYCQHSSGKLARDFNGAIRIIITQKYFDGGHHKLRMKKVDQIEKREFNHDYIEIVPKGIITDPTRPEDRH